MGRAANASAAQRRMMSPDIFMGANWTFPIEDQADVDYAAQVLSGGNNCTALANVIKARATTLGLAVPADFAQQTTEPNVGPRVTVHATAFSMDSFIELGEVTFATDNEPMVKRRGKVFAAGDYPDKNFFATPEHLLVAGMEFQPVPNRVQHISPKITPTYFDGHLGTLDKLELSTDGETVIGEVTIPAWFDIFMRNKHPDKPLSVSLEFDRNTRRVIGNTFVPNPRIADSALVAAFAAPHGVQAVHDMTMAHGAVCATDDATMSLGHDQFIQKVHDVTKAHGAQCVPQKAAAPMANSKSFMETLKEMIGMGGVTGLGGAVVVPPAVPVRAEETPVMSTPQPTAEFAELKARLETQERENQRLREKDAARDKERRTEKAATFADKAIAEKKFFASAAESLKKLYVQAALDDSNGVATFDSSEQGSRVVALQTLVDLMPVHFMLEEQLKDTDMVELANRVVTAKGKQPETPAQSRIDELMAMAPTGRTIIAERNGK